MISIHFSIVINCTQKLKFRVESSRSTTRIHLAYVQLICSCPLNLTMHFDLLPTNRTWPKYLNCISPSPLCTAQLTQMITKRQIKETYFFFSSCTLGCSAPAVASTCGPSTGASAAISDANPNSVDFTAALIERAMSKSRAQTLSYIRTHPFPLFAPEKTFKAMYVADMRETPGTLFQGDRKSGYGVGAPVWFELELTRSIFNPCDWELSAVQGDDKSVIIWAECWV